MKKVYGIIPAHKWPDYPGFSVLINPDSGKWIAFCMEKGIRGSIAENRSCMDVKCSREGRNMMQYAGFCPPFYMRGQEWTGIILEKFTNSDAIKYALDEAVKETSRSGDHASSHLITLTESNTEEDYKSSALPNQKSYVAEGNVPKKILQMMNMYDYGHYSWQDKCRNFYQQGMFMKDYSDTEVWDDSFAVGRQPVYHSLNTAQLRGYFAWRTIARKGFYQKTNDAYARIYCYEMINQISAEAAEDGLKLLALFQEKYLDKGYGDASLRYDFKGWMKDYCVVYHLPVEQYYAFRSEEENIWEKSVGIIMDSSASDDDFLNAVVSLTGTLKSFSSIYSQNLSEMKKLLHRIWNELRNNKDADVFLLCFGQIDERRWFPFRNAVYYDDGTKPSSVYQVSKVHSYRYSNGYWYEKCVHPEAYDRSLLKYIIHEIDRIMRQHYSSRKLSAAKPRLGWIDDAIEKSIQNYEQEKQEALRPKIIINSDHLKQIRSDALQTKDLLLTDEERQAEEEEKPEEIKTESIPTEDNNPLNETEKQLLRMILAKRDVRQWLRSRHLFASAVTDEINEKLYDSFNDTVLECDGTDITVIEDYRSELKKLAEEEE